MSGSVGGPSREHQNLVRELVDYLGKQGWTVTHADGIDNYPKPYEIGGRVPDIIARNSGGVLAFGEAETCEFLNDQQTIDQIDAFSNQEMRTTKETVPFFILVPESCRGNLRELIQTRFPGRNNIVQLYLPKANP
jgi:hypothetical protein